MLTMPRLLIWNLFLNPPEALFLSLKDDNCEGHYYIPSMGYRNLSFDYNWEDSRS